MSGSTWLGVTEPSSAKAAAIQNLYAAAGPDWPSVVTRLSRYFEVNAIDMRGDG